MHKTFLMARGKSEGIFPLENLTFLTLNIQYTFMYKTFLVSRDKAERIFPMVYLALFNYLYSIYLHTKRFVIPEAKPSVSFQWNI